MSVRTTPLLALLIASTTATAQVPLRDLPQLARARAERLRPKQIEALMPFWPDLVLKYETNKAYLDERIEMVAKLGDSVVPLLLEKLQPAQRGEESRELAANCRRVLERLDPSSFVDALAEMARSEHDIARSQAIRLLGHADVPQSVTVLASLLDTVGEADRLAIVRALRDLRARSVAPQVVHLLGSSDVQMRDAVLTYLAAARAGQVADVVVAALQQESTDRLLSAYIEYFHRSVDSHLGATEALLPLLDSARLDWQDTRKLVEALATVAPEGHDATLQALHSLIKGNETSAQSVSAAVSLQALGDKQGVRRLKKALDDRIRSNRRSPMLYEQRARLMFAIGDYKDAARDYEALIENTDGVTTTHRAYVGLILSEAHQDHIQTMVRHMKDSGMTPEEFADLMRTHPVFRTACEHERAQSFLKRLERERAPK